VDGSEGTTAGRLWFDVAEETYNLGPEASLTFGRAAKAIVDPENPYMHRIVGRVYFDRWCWWLENSARHMPMTMIGNDDRLKTLPAGAAEPLTTAQGVVRFYAGAAGYEVAWELEVPPTPANRDADPEGADTVTAEFGNVRLSSDQRRMMAAMAEPQLLDPGSRSPLPANAEIATRCGWTLKQFDRKLDYLCRRLAESGVPGLRGRPGTEAADRRERLVRHVLHNGLITADDLVVLDRGEPVLADERSC